MPEIEDWLKDPLRKVENGEYKSRKLKTSVDEQSERWRTFHFATRLKLDGADYFCRQVLGAASMPDNLGLPLLAHRQLSWYLDAFFFELMSACDTLLQELNIVYAYDMKLKPEDVSWNKIKSKLPQKVVDYMNEERGKDWFDSARRYRNLATHHYRVPTGSETAGFGEDPLDYQEHIVTIDYMDREGNFKSEDIIVCREYLRQMARYIIRVWQEMTQEFE